MSAALFVATQIAIRNMTGKQKTCPPIKSYTMNRNALTISIGFDDHISTYIVDRDDVMVESVGGRDLGVEELKDTFLEAAEDVIDGDQGELFLDTTDPDGAKEFWKQYDELVD